MNKNLLITMLNKGNNGNEILSILDSITTNDVVDETIETNSKIATPTLEYINF